MKTSCEIIKDILPLYHDNVCSEESRAMIDEHLKECISCVKVLDNISDELAHHKKEFDDIKPIKAIQKVWKKDKTKSFVLGSILTAVLLIAGALFYTFNNGVIGVSADKVESDARKGQKISDSWNVVMASNERIIAMLFYNEAHDDHTFSIYANNPGFSFGYHFRAGGSSSEIELSVFSRPYDVSDEVVMLSMNNIGVARIDYFDDEAIINIDIDPAKPFAIIVPVDFTRISQVRFYDAKGDEIKPWDEFLHTMDIDLTNDGSISANAGYISYYMLSTNSKRISVVVSGDIVSDNASVALYDAEGSVEILVMQIRADKRSGEFTHLTSAKTYYVVATGLAGCDIILSD